MLPVRSVRMETDETSFFALSGRAAASGVGAERTVRKVLAKARMGRKVLMLAARVRWYVWAGECSNDGRCRYLGLVD